MEEQVNIEEVLKNMRETIGALAQENAILKAQINQSTT
jgi:ribosomal protein L12E/L44/L45/RPP1/RPP2